MEGREKESGRGMGQCWEEREEKKMGMKGKRFRGGKVIFLLKTCAEPLLTVKSQEICQQDFPSGNPQAKGTKACFILKLDQMF